MNPFGLTRKMFSFLGLSSKEDIFNDFRVYARQLLDYKEARFDPGLRQAQSWIQPVLDTPDIDSFIANPQLPQETQELVGMWRQARLAATQASTMLEDQLNTANALDTKVATTEQISFLIAATDIFVVALHTLQRTTEALAMDAADRNLLTDVDEYPVGVRDQDTKGKQSYDTMTFDVGSSIRYSYPRPMKQHMKELGLRSLDTPASLFQRPEMRSLLSLNRPQA
jgi:hypothetical protein